MFIRLSLGAALAAAFAATAVAKPVTTTAETNLRKAPGTKSEMISTVPRGTEVDVGDCDAGWCKVIWGGQEGYVIARNLGMVVPGAPREAAAPQTTVPRQAPRQATNLNKLRRGYEDQFEDQAADQSVTPQQRQYATRRPAPQTEDDDDDVAYGTPDGYVPMAQGRYYAAPGYYYGGPRYYGGWGWGPGYYRRW
jgi:uncharacterized protein YgiM (DUF1202 family)